MSRTERTGWLRGGRRFIKMRLRKPPKDRGGVCSGAYQPRAKPRWGGVGGRVALRKAVTLKSITCHKVTPLTKGTASHTRAGGPQSRPTIGTASPSARVQTRPYPSPSNPRQTRTAGVGGGGRSPAPAQRSRAQAPAVKKNANAKAMKTKHKNHRPTISLEAALKTRLYPLRGAAGHRETKPLKSTSAQGVG